MPDANPVDAWCSKMMKNGEFVDNIFIQIFAEMIQSDVIIIPVHGESAANGLCTVVKGGGNDTPGSNCPIFLGFFEETKFAVPHYQAVVPYRVSSITNLILDYGGVDVKAVLNLPDDIASGLIFIYYEQFHFLIQTHNRF